MRAANERRRRNPAQHQCDICVQTFTTQFSLTRHKQSHTGEKPYICSHTGCGQTFFNSSDCKRHERSTRKHPNSNTIASGRRGVAAPPE
ncbi:hypothetical protein BJ138DRAFT_1145264 [Hygrophoropsis aurantiaca]|uniref:Uncharacterized protein n=1 Tax=Hygrophoropsis aurantiaca TaxID=72124 RepID=A0ACB8AMK0_9AGAM|nr:hypothetical protein BJ138DRAFT_1145264 [Hygrophoropsis aurantiaca]